jgi:hypothetical protein
LLPVTQNTCDSGNNSSDAVLIGVPKPSGGNQNKVMPAAPDASCLYLLSWLFF